MGVVGLGKAAKLEAVPAWGPSLFQVLHHLAVRLKLTAKCLQSSHSQASLGFRVRLEAVSVLGPLPPPGN